ncbi:unnamed protein product [Effrenium voratum]|uniref:AmmeMemoRadiSam system protein B n=1 Tax=Effrenium voratum TaxID=2562239 RepID=A0AA36IKB1_9DINO|nr:unnamed protein product [Effrenium voratum]
MADAQSGAPSALLAEIEAAYVSPFGPGSLPSRPRTLKSPPNFMLLVSHGAACDSFPIVAHAYHRLAEEGIPPTVLIIGTNHRCLGANIALSRRPWRSPLGTSQVDTELLQSFLDSGYVVDEQGHAAEHSIENQLPFLQHLAPEVRILALGLAQLSFAEAQNLARDVARITADRNVLILATTDYLHAGEGYYDQPPRGLHLHEFIRQRDAPVLAAVAALDSELLLRTAGATGMCGLWPAVVLLLAAQELGFTECQLLKYAVSGEARAC